ncbi:acyl-CoA dehydrogenase family protein [Terasakiella pusilla]|uniref:acyl-CoA dehydrogenase family protein n=1 Tax=Terasakiella pusilla TaxID=64973 RepID=UPI00068DDBF5|nr:acyl-CoA dehydrogenase family protein [Terasakiella pusilla]
MKPFSAPIEDILFSLSHIAKADDVEGWDRDLTSEIAHHFAAFAEGEIAPIDEPGDREGCKLVDGRVVMPKGYKEVYTGLAEQGWQGLTAPEEQGGQAMGALVHGVISEVFSGACHALQMVTGLVPGAIRTIMKFGTEDQQARLIPPLVEGRWLATMCLTEPGAGSDLSQVRCKATEGQDGWRINGEKIFISGGDQDLSTGILHLVLARTSEEGVKGLSLFLCQSSKPDGSRNDITVTRIEEKMGLHASPTCQLAFDDAHAELIGNLGDGLKAMFTMMNHARIDVALQGVAHAARAYDVAGAYAAERVQGRNLLGEKVTLDQHSDVRRMLDECDALALGSRAITHLALVAMEKDARDPLVDFLTPLAKVCGTEAGMRAAELGVQVLGGYGYLSEYRLEQTYRDARITAIYEGANGIHALTLATRLLTGAQLKSAQAFENLMLDECDVAGSSELQEALILWQSMKDKVAGMADPSATAHDFMALTIQLTLVLVWTRYVKGADEHHDPERIKRVGKMGLVDASLKAKLHAGKIARL